MALQKKSQYLSNNQKDKLRAKILGSIVKGQIVCGKRIDQQLWENRETMKIPDQSVLQQMSLEQMRELSISKIVWRRMCCFYIDMFGMTLSDGQEIKAGSVDVAKDEFFFKDKKVTKVEIVVDRNEEHIRRIIFFRGDE